MHDRPKSIMKEVFLILSLLQAFNSGAQTKTYNSTYRITILRTDSTKEKGFLVGIDSNNVVMHQYRRKTALIPASSIERIQITDKRLVRKGMNKGALKGALIVGIIFAINHEPAQTQGFKSTGTASPLVDFTAGAILGAVVGIPVGALMNTKRVTFNIQGDHQKFLSCRNTLITEMEFK